jgi:sugar phosphate isomerase/epimerase
MPFSNIDTLDVALELIAAAEAGDTGLCLDIWHLLRGGIDFAQVADLPADVIATVELNDGPAAPAGSLWDDAVENRTVCGAGTFDIPCFLHAIERTGYSGPYGVEIMGIEHRQRPLQEIADAVFETTAEQFRQARV